jgi:hypothetical protein
LHHCGKARNYNAATITAFVAEGFSFDDEPMVNSKRELTVATSGPHNLRRCSNG